MGTLSAECDKISIGKLQVPFKESFRHTTQERHETDTVIVIAQGSSKLEGYGEGCPRPYVTGETTESALSFFRTVSHWLPKQVSLETLHALKTELKEEIDAHPAAYCAIEMALLDLLGKATHQPLEDLLGTARQQNSPHCSFVIGLDSFEERLRKWHRALRMGFRHFKFKISGTPEDLEFLNHGLQIKPKLRWPNRTPWSFRLDGNGCFDSVIQAANFLNKIAVPIDAVEEPLTLTHSVTDLVELSRRVGIPLILDENFTRQEQVEKLVPYKEHFILNLRLSKLGGILRTLDVIQRAQAEGIQMSLGCQVGETSLLTRAQLIISNGMKAPSPLYFEGGFGPHLLLPDPASPPQGLKVGGKIRGISPQPGLGMKLDTSVLTF